MNIFRIGIWVAAAAVAAFVGLSSYVIANQLRAPQLSAAVGVAPQSATRGNLAFLSYFARQAKDRDALVSERELELARQAYRSSPLSLSAIAIIAQAADKDRGRQQLLDAAGKLSRRNAAITAQLVDSAARRGDERAFFEWLSRAALTDMRQRDLYVKSMALATARPASVAALTPVLGRNPAWADYYWQNVATKRDSLDNAARLRMAIAARPWNRTAVTDEDRVLVEALVRQHAFEVATRLARRLAPASGHTGVNLLQNADFARQPVLPPLDWELAASGNLGATIVEREKALLVSAIGGAQGAVARQLIQLSPGSYDLGWSLSGVDAAAAPLTVQLACAEKGKGDVASDRFALASGKRVLRIGLGGDCRWYWFTIGAALGDNAPGVDAYLRDVSLTRAGPAPAPQDGGEAGQRDDR